MYCFQLFYHVFVDDIANLVLQFVLFGEDEPVKQLKDLYNQLHSRAKELINVIWPPSSKMAENTITPPQVSQV